MLLAWSRGGRFGALLPNPRRLQPALGNQGAMQDIVYGVKPWPVKPVKRPQIPLS